MPLEKVVQYTLLCHDVDNLVDPLRDGGGSGILCIGFIGVEDSVIDTSKSVRLCLQ